MAKGKVSYTRYLQIRREAEEVAATIKTPGWKILEDDLLRQAGQIEELLAQNRLRTVTETVATGGTTKTFTTTAETQIAENAGMYKMIQSLFTTIQTIVEAPDKLARLEEKGQVRVEKAAEGTPVEERTVRFKIPRTLEKIRQRVVQAIKERQVK